MKESYLSGIGKKPVVGTVKRVVPEQPLILFQTAYFHIGGSGDIEQSVVLENN
ncbi:MAG: hypothetical protein FWC43_04380 [Planctomycetaceae bacterium]|nr:hypothetical protein [Planctomycetaceae bacterium]